MTDVGTAAKGKALRLWFSSERDVPHDAQEQAGDLIWAWDEQHRCVAGVLHGGTRSEGGGIFGLALKFIPGDDALKELLRTLSPLVGPLQFIGVC